MSPEQDPTEKTRYAIRADSVQVTYDDGYEALRDVTLEVPEGAFFGFLGPNGAGKTTFIKTLVTLLEPTNGTVTVNGYDIDTEPQKVRESVGYMPQETSVDEELTARENISFACDMYAVPAAERDDRIDELLDVMDLADVANDEASDFSGGMKKRLDAAMSLVHEPPVVFLDEPSTGLDPEVRNGLWDYLREINKQGTTVFLTTQYMEEADALCDQITLLQDGEVVVQNTPETLKSQVGGEVLDITFADRSEETKQEAVTVAKESEMAGKGKIRTTESGLRVTAPEARRHGPDLLASLFDKGITVTGFDVRSPTLDDVFLTLTGETVEKTEDEQPESDQIAQQVENLQ